MTRSNWRALIEGMIDAVWLVDSVQLRVIAANSAAEKLLGVAPHALVGRPVVELAFTPEDVFFWEDVAAGLSDQIFSDSMLQRTNGETLMVERRVSRVRLDDFSSIYVVAVRDLGAQRQVENELETLIAELRATLESTADGILVTDLNGAIRACNQRFAELWSVPRDMLSQRDDEQIYGWMDQAVVDAEHYTSRLREISRSPLLEASDVVVLRNGVVLERVTLPQYARGRPVGRVFSFRDISRRLQDEAQLQIAAKVFEASLEAIFVTDADFLIVAANPSCERLTGCTREELIGHRPREFLSNRYNEDALDTLSQQIACNGFWEGEMWNRGKNGAVYPCLVAMVRVADEQNQTKHFIGFFKDLTESFSAKKRIEELAYRDALTGLPNRLLLAERVEQAIALAQRNATAFAVLFLDLDRFKHINDSLGHMFGDRVLVEVAERLSGCVRQVDTAARLGGDEFVLLLNQTDTRGAETAAQRVLEALSRPFELDEMAFSLSCSIGIALFPDDGDCMDELIKNADSAMYYVKERGRSGFRFYQRQMNIDLLSRMKLDHAMRVALRNGYFRLHYQPQIELGSQRLVGVEALLRWNDPELGEVSPAQFIPLAEESGVIVPIGTWVLEEAVRQATAWFRRNTPVQVAVNVSALQFEQADFVDHVAETLHSAGLPPELLELELTESILVRDADEALKRLQALAELGVKLAIDDFGTGYSSLGYLKRFPIQKLKIDRSFIQDVPDDDSDVAIVNAVINLAQALRLRVIAEGVEHPAQVQFLSDAGCHEFQGFFCSRAMEPEVFEAFHRDMAVKNG